MVNGVYTIPLLGQNPGSSSGLNAFARPSAEFIAGSENSLADVAIRACFEQSWADYSPLVLYGPHGSGKSHLARGLAAWWLAHLPTPGVACLAGSEFAQAYSSAVRDDRLELWRREIRGTSLLVIDDLGQLSGRDGAQRELRQSLDVLAEREVLVVVTARTLPAHSRVLLPSLRSRLSAGLAVPLALPGRTTRRFILERLAAARGISLPERAVCSLADGLNVSVPALIGAVKELELVARTNGRAIDAAGVRQFMAERAGTGMPQLRDIACLTAKYFALTLADLKSPLRRQPLVAARSMAMYLARQMTRKSLEQIGAFFGGRDHTTVLHGCRRTENLLRRDRATRQAVADLKRMLTAS